jgi:hypothetical protein
MSQTGHERTFRGFHVTSDSPPITDMFGWVGKVSVGHGRSMIVIQAIKADASCPIEAAGTPVAAIPAH